MNFVCGANCVADKLHIWTDYPVIPQPCLPELAVALVAAQAQMTTRALAAVLPFGMVTAETADIFVPTTDTVLGSAVYRSFHAREYMYRCQERPSVWVLSETDDRDAWGRCEGRLWIDFESSQSWAGGLDGPLRTGGLYIDTFDQCSELFSSPQGLDAILEPTGDFRAGVSDVQVACALVGRLGTYSNRASRLTVRLPALSDPIKLLGDIVVKAGESLTLTSFDVTQSATLLLGPSQLRVALGGQLELEGLTLLGSRGGSAVRSEGEVTVRNCNFERCVAATNAILRYAEANVPRGSTDHPPLAGAALGAFGGAAFSFGSQAVLTVEASVFAQNAVRDARVLNGYGPPFVSYWNAHLAGRTACWSFGLQGRRDLGFGPACFAVGHRAASKHCGGWS